jgi:hypothetical protein
VLSSERRSKEKKSTIILQKRKKKREKEKILGKNQKTLKDNIKYYKYYKLKYYVLQYLKKVPLTRFVKVNLIKVDKYYKNLVENIVLLVEKVSENERGSKREERDLVLVK